jgi:hypothetical protein
MMVAVRLKARDRFEQAIRLSGSVRAGAATASALDSLAGANI